MRIEWEGPNVVLVHLQEAKRAPSFPWNEGHTERFVKVPNRKVSEVIVHHSGGNFYNGQKGADAITRFAIALKEKGGRGWPGNPYTFIVPSFPERNENGKLQVFRIWEDSWRTWHTGGFHNTHGVGVCVVGTYASSAHPGGNQQPSSDAMEALEELILGYLLPRYGLTPERGLHTHSEFGKPACPGSYVTQWVQSFRETSKEPTLLDVQSKLRSLGYNPGPLDGIWGVKTRSAVVKFQKKNKLKVDGLVGKKTLAALGL